MIIRKVTESQLDLAADAARVVLTTKPKGRGFQVKVERRHLGPWQRLGFQRRADGERRRCNGVCWHGFREFMRQVYALAPDAVFVTAMIRYDGSEDFEAKHGETYHVQVGSQQADPAYYGELCECSEGWAS